MKVLMILWITEAIVSSHLFRGVGVNDHGNFSWLEPREASSLLINSATPATIFIMHINIHANNAVKLHFYALICVNKRE